MEVSADSMTSKLCGDAKIFMSDRLEYRFADALERPVGTACCDPGLQRILGHLYELPTFVIHIADEEGAGRIAVEAVLERCDVDVHYVAVLERPLNSSGMPCVTTLLMLVQHDLGYPL